MFCAPTWVFGSINLKDDFDVFAQQNKNTRYTVNTLKKAKFKVETSAELLLFDEFFHKMHQPYMFSRHGKSAFEESYQRMKARFSKNGEILFIVEGSQRIAGIMLCFDGKEAMAYRLGVRDGDFQWVTKGAINALYYHAIKYCQSKGIMNLNLGGSRPFFSDGVLTYKLRKWNMKIDDYSKHFYFLFKPLKNGRFTKNFLCNNPFISLNKKKMVVNTFCEDGSEKSRDVEALKTQYARKGAEQRNHSPYLKRQAFFTENEKPISLVKKQIPTDLMLPTDVSCQGPLSFSIWTMKLCKLSCIRFFFNSSAFSMSLNSPILTRYQMPFPDISVFTLYAEYPFCFNRATS